MAAEWRLFPDAPASPPPLTPIVRLDPAYFIDSALADLLLVVIDHFESMLASEEGRLSDGLLKIGEELHDRAEPRDLGSSGQVLMYTATQLWLRRYNAVLEEYSKDKICALLTALGRSSSRHPEDDWDRATQTARALRGALASPAILNIVRTMVPQVFWTPGLTLVTAAATIDSQPDLWFFDECAAPLTHATYDLDDAWLQPVMSRFLVVGDGNLRRLPFTRDPRLAIHIFPGASLTHAVGIMDRVGSAVDQIERIILSFRPDSVGDITHREMESVVNNLVNITAEKFPRAEILLALIPIPENAAREVAAPLHVANIYLGMRPCIPALMGSGVDIETAGGVWSFAMGSEVWDLWSRYLF